MTTTTIKAAAPDQGIWWAVRHRVEPRAYGLMVESAREEGFCLYTPQELRWRRVMVKGRLSKTCQWVEQPLINGYSFMRPDPGRRQTIPMARLYGVMEVLGANHGYGALRQAVIDRIISREVEVKVARDGKDVVLRGAIVGDDERKQFGKLPPDEWRASLKPGQAVEVEMLDAFYTAIVQANDAGGRLTVLLDFMGRSCPFVVTLPTKVREVAKPAGENH